MNSNINQNPETPTAGMETFQVTQGKFPKGFELNTKQEGKKIGRNTYYRGVIVTGEHTQEVLVTKTGRYLSLGGKNISHVSLYRDSFIKNAMYIWATGTNGEKEDMIIDTKLSVLRTTEGYKIVSFPRANFMKRNVTIEDGNGERRDVVLDENNGILKTSEGLEILFMYSKHNIFGRKLAQAKVRNKDNEIIEVMIDTSDMSIATTHEGLVMRYFYSSGHEGLYDGTVYDDKWEVEETCLQEDGNLAHTDSGEDILTLRNVPLNGIEIGLEAKIRGKNSLVREVYLDKNRKIITTELGEEITDMRPNNNGYSYKTISGEFWKNDEDFLFMLSNVLRLIHETAEKTEQLVENK